MDYWEDTLGPENVFTPTDPSELTEREGRAPEGPRPRCLSGVLRLLLGARRRAVSSGLPGVRIPDKRRRGRSRLRQGRFLPLGLGGVMQRDYAPSFQWLPPQPPRDPDFTLRVRRLLAMTRAIRNLPEVPHPKGLE